MNVATGLAFFVFCAALGCKIKHDNSQNKAIIDNDGEAKGIVRSMSMMAVRHVPKEILTGQLLDSSMKTSPLAYSLVECIASTRIFSADMIDGVEAYGLEDRAFVDSTSAVWVPSDQNRMISIPGCLMLPGSPKMKIREVGELFDTLRDPKNSTISPKLQALFLAIRGPFNPNKQKAVSGQVLRLNKLAESEGLKLKFMENLHAELIGLDDKLNPCKQEIKDGYFRKVEISPTLCHYAPGIGKKTYDEISLLLRSQVPQTNGANLSLNDSNPSNGSATSSFVPFKDEFFTDAKADLKPGNVVTSNPFNANDGIVFAGNNPTSGKENIWFPKSSIPKAMDPAKFAKSIAKGDLSNLSADIPFTAYSVPNDGKSKDAKMYIGVPNEGKPGGSIVTVPGSYVDGRFEADPKYLSGTVTALNKMSGRKDLGEFASLVDTQGKRFKIPATDINGHPIDDGKVSAGSNEAPVKDPAAQNAGETTKSQKSLSDNTQQADDEWRKALLDLESKKDRISKGLGGDIEVQHQKFLDKTGQPLWKDYKEELHKIQSDYDGKVQATYDRYKVYEEMYKKDKKSNYFPSDPRVANYNNYQDELSKLKDQFVAQQSKALGLDGQLPAHHFERLPF